ncbi:hypothetical protein [Clostridium chauvoei]|uniref:Uncharacterized protein n=4 Tax=Clostridium chauvoei TaxID=46867 RepID=A0A1U6JBE0_9CLOT|nr:hypothetical protein [Clostridium chauvoei]ATD55005.1 hypothetical protein BTM20_07040 [Clostridium chauvoei]ATD57317.1 hypothetical protein BTM21_06015 [Clostridium chauvoei]MBX7279344.1 hypothetical protein [Clostridium chauvoei]MBX7283884.1 hypothetical protein [Clostridium chauvoei]MBX7285542.1 hypothetical protein [Clostridium chauvoei]
MYNNIVKNIIKSDGVIMEKIEEKRLYKQYKGYLEAMKGEPFINENTMTYEDYIQFMISLVENDGFYVETEEQLEKVLFETYKKNFLGEVKNQRFDFNINFSDKYFRYNKEDKNENIYEKWYISKENVEERLKDLKTLAIKNKFKLVSYKIKDDVEEKELVFAFNKEEKVPNPEECLDGEIDEYDVFNKPLKPENALRNFMEAIEGEKTKEGYLEAALLYHRLKENNEIKSIENINEELPHFYYNYEDYPVIEFYAINKNDEVVKYIHIFSESDFTVKVISRIV